MPCYLFTYHAYGSWMPDRKQGYVRREQGIVPRDDRMHALYSDAMKGEMIGFEQEHQRVAIDAVLNSQEKQRFVAYCIATDASHLHILLSWSDERDRVKMRGLVKGSISRSLNNSIISQQWFSAGGSYKRVKDRKHFDFLMNHYLPSHNGEIWSRDARGS